MARALLVCREAKLWTGELAKQRGCSSCPVLSREVPRAEMNEKAFRSKGPFHRPGAS